MALVFFTLIKSLTFPITVFCRMCYLVRLVVSIATCVITTLNVHHCTGVTSVHLYRYVVYTVHIRHVTTAHVIQVSELCTQQNKCHKTIKH